MKKKKDGNYRNKKEIKVENKIKGNKKIKNK